MTTTFKLRLLAVLGLLGGLMPFTSGCGGDVDDEDEEQFEESDAALSQRTLNAGDCRSVRAVNRSTAEGVWNGTLSGCIVARGNETGAQMVARALAIVASPAEIGQAKRTNGRGMFASYKPTAARSSGTGVTYDARAGFDIVGPFDAKGTLRFVSARTDEGGMSVTVTNITSIGAVGINPIQPNGLSFVVRLVPAANGVVVRGNVNVTLVSHKSNVNNVSALGPQIVEWMKRRLGGA